MGLNSPKEKQMDDYKYMKLCRVCQGDRLGSRVLAEPHKSHFTHTDWNMTEASIKAACPGHLFFPCFHVSSFAPYVLHFYGLCRKSMRNRLHSGREWVWLSTNKHYGQSGGTQSGDLSESAHTHLVLGRRYVFNGCNTKSHKDFLSDQRLFLTTDQICFG